MPDSPSPQFLERVQAETGDLLRAMTALTPQRYAGYITIGNQQDGELMTVAIVFSPAHGKRVRELVEEIQQLQHAHEKNGTMEEAQTAWWADQEGEKEGEDGHESAEG